MIDSYRIYGHSRKFYKWEKLTVLYKEELVNPFIETISGNTYSKVMVIKHDAEKKCDESYLLTDLQRPMERVRTCRKELR